MKIIIFDAGRRNHTQTGYGTMSHQFGERLKNFNHEIYYYDEHNYPDKVDLWLWIRPPHYVEYKEFNPDNCNVFFTMCEQSVFQGWKSNWTKLLNKCNAIITPTEWNKQVWIGNGVTVPVYVAPLGVDTKVFKGGKTYEFSILSVFEGLGRDSSRELWKENIEAYFELFYDNHYNEVIYNIKSWNMDWAKYRKFLKVTAEKFNYDPLKLPAINTLDFDLVNADMNALYSKHWAFLKNSKGEGWCLPAIEAVSVGIRVMSKPLSAMVYLNDKNCDFFVHYEGLKKVMWENWRRYRKQKAAIGEYSWKESTIKLDMVLREITNET